MDASTQQQHAETFHGLHSKGDPFVLFNVWDVATAKAVAKTSPAVATSSGAVASALGYADGEDVPFDMVTGLVSRMTAAVSVPVSIDLEAGYGDTPDAAAKSTARILKAGAIGINIEDGLSGGKRQLVSPKQHAAKIIAGTSVAGTRQKFSLLQQLSLLSKVDLPWLRLALDGERCDGFRMPARTNVAACTRAGVRKRQGRCYGASGEEIASIDAVVNRAMEPHACRSHSSASLMTSADR